MEAKDMYIKLEGLRLFARHGVLPQERTIGAEFTIDLKLKTDFSKAAATDELDGTLNYAEVFGCVKEVMSSPSLLLEHVCQRIAERLFDEFPSLMETEIRLFKQNPPMGADCDRVGVEVHYIR